MSSINSRVPPLRLAAVDKPADGEVAAYQASSGQFEWVANGSGGGGTVTSVGLTETGTALTITNSPITGSGTINIAGAGNSSQVILGDLTLGTLTSGTVTSVSSSQAFITITDATTTPSISIGNASASTTGVLTSTDWNTFNNKGSGTVTGTGLANQVSYWTGTSVQAGSTNLTFDGTNLQVGGYIESGTGKFTTDSGTTNLTLDTNDGAGSSGSIVIEAGGNGQISINPHGIGTVKIDGVQIDNSAIATGYVLKATSTTAAGWAAESGGGSGIGGSISDNQVAVGAATTNEIEGYSDFTYNDATDTLTVGEKVTSSGTTQLQLVAGSSTISILDSGVANHININPASNRINAQASTLSLGTSSSDATLSSSGAYNLILNTNDGTNSGSIVIADGVDGQISITPNGAGTIKLDGVELDNSAIATGYVLKATSATEAGWAAESGGGSSYPVSMATAIDINDDTFILTSFPPYPRSITSTSSQSIDTSVYYIPFIPPKNITLTNLQVNITTSGTGNLSMALYDSDTVGNPNDILTNSTVTIDASSTGYFTSTLASSQSLSGLTLYYIALTMSANSCSVRSHPSDSSYGTAPVNGLNTYNRPLIYDSTTTTLPSSVTPSQLSTKYGFPPMIGGGF